MLVQAHHMCGPRTGLEGTELAGHTVMIRESDDLRKNVSSDSLQDIEVLRLETNHVKCKSYLSKPSPGGRSPSSSQLVRVSSFSSTIPSITVSSPAQISSSSFNSSPPCSNNGSETRSHTPRILRTNW